MYCWIRLMGVVHWHFSSELCSFQLFMHFLSFNETREAKNKERYLIKMMTFFQLPDIKKTSFLAGTSFHFRPFLFR